jgi:hypothetical protein
MTHFKAAGRAEKKATRLFDLKGPPEYGDW